MNGLGQQIRIIEAHIIDHGFNLLYKIWRYHGKLDPVMDPIGHKQGDNTSDEILNVLEDVIGPTHKLPVEDEHANNFKIEPLYREKYDDLFAKIETELYLGCQKFSLLNFLAKLMHLKVLNKWTNRSFGMLLKLLKEVFLEGCKLPDSHYATKKLLAKLGLGYELIHVYKNDCSIFWRDTTVSEQCRVCGESRWIDKNTKGKKRSS